VAELVLDRAQALLTQLRLPRAAQRLPALLQEATQHAWTVAELLEALLTEEREARKATALAMRLGVAHFPFQKSLGTFDFAFQPSVDEALLRELASCAFIPQGLNVVFVGPPGVGKTHLAVALGMAACQQGLSTRFFRAAGLVQSLVGALQQQRLEERLRPLSGTYTKLVIVDELGYLPFDRVGAELFFQFVCRRYERGSLIVTTNQPFSRWGEVFGDPVLATAILDRLLHHSVVIQITGESYRLREKRQAGLLPKGAPLGGGGVKNDSHKGSI